MTIIVSGGAVVNTGSTNTVQVLIDRAVRLLGKLNSGESASVQESADSLIALNAWLDSQRNDGLMCYTMQDESVTISSGNNTRTLGPSGNLVTTRPVEIQTAYILYSGVRSPVTILTDDEWASLPEITSTSTYPNRINYKPDMPNGTLYLYPVPNASSVLHLITRVPVLAFTSVADTVSLPPGWEEAIATNLAIAIAPEFRTEPSTSVIRAAALSIAAIKRVNSRPQKAYTDLSLLVGRSHSSILTG